VLRSLKLLSDVASKPHIAHMQKCIETRDGILVAGTIDQAGKRSYWLTKFDASGNLTSERLIPLFIGEHSESGVISNLVECPNGDLLLFDSGFDNGHTAVRLSADGVVKARGLFGVPVLPPAGPIKLLQSIPERGDPVLMVYDDSLRPTSRMRIKSDGLHRLTVYALETGALASFGDQERGVVGTAALGWMDPSQGRAQTAVLQPTYGSVFVDAAVPTGKPGEFAIVRSLIPGMHRTFGGPDESRSGVLLTFIQYK
jgi:hypothetical protein